MVGRLGWVTITAREDAAHYDLFADPAKPTMIARDGLKVAAPSERQAFWPGPPCTGCTCSPNAKTT